MLKTIRICIRVPLRQAKFRNFSKQVEELNLAKGRALEDTAIRFPSSFQRAERFGKGLLAGASGAGLLALCYYGLGMSGEESAADRAFVWPSYVRERINATYGYLAGSLAFTGASAAMFSRSARGMNFLATRPYMSIGLFLAGAIGSGMVCRSLPYAPEQLLPKIAAFGTMCGVTGISLAPLTMLGGPLIVKAALYTAGVVGALSLTAATAPSDKFLSMSGPLSIGLGVVCVSAIGGLFLPVTSAVGGVLYSVSLYGGLVLFSGFMLYDTQRVIKYAELSPTYDPINACLGIYWNTINIFIRIVTILAGSSKRK